MQKLIAIALTSFLFWLSCQKNETFDPDGQSLEFSADTILFDTIFSGIGSATKTLKVYNRGNTNITISEIGIAKGNQSKYMLNIDGRPSTAITNIKLRKNDSLYIFVKVLINTNQDALLEQDSIVFKLEGKIRDVKLLAWGQDVHLINGKIIQTETWTGQKPYLVYNSMLVDENQVLTIAEGTKIYFHRGSRLYVSGTLKIEGSLEKPVTLQGDRLEPMYSDVPGQWEGIWLMNGSKHNQMDYAIIKNAIIGIQVDTLADITVPTLKISNSRIQHMSFAGIYAQGSTIFATNCLIADCGFYAVALTIGGSYEFYHCTFANYWQNSFRNTPSVLLNNYYTYQGKPIIRDIVRAGFYNCLVWGNRENEIMIDAYPGAGILNYEFNHCLLRFSSASKLNTNFLKSCILNQDPLFEDFEKYHFGLEKLSPAIDKASPEWINKYPAYLMFDILKKNRLIDIAPDMGAFEFGE
jgi:hypothetical protein